MIKALHQFNQWISTLLFKNTSIYKGKIFLDFDKMPYWSGGSILNSILLNLDFTKLVTRLIPNEVPVFPKRGVLVELTKKNINFQNEIDPLKMDLIIRYTEGIISEYWVDNREPKFDYLLPNSFQSKSGVFLGDANDGWWYYKNNMVVTKKHPHGCAKKIKKQYYKNRLNNDEEIEGFYGYTHRGGCLFKIGDKLFEEKFNLTQPNDLLNSEYQVIIKKHKKQIKNHENIEETYDFIKERLCFNKRGHKTIKTWEEAEQAAINLSKYLG